MKTFFQRYPILVRWIKAGATIIPNGVIPLVVWRRRLILNKLVFNATSGVIKYGLFRGQKLSGSVAWGDTDMASQILGFYELEVLEEIQNSGDRTLLINLGAADGYYLVGWARTMSDFNRIRNSRSL